MTIPSTTSLIPQTVDIRTALARGAGRITLPGLKGSAAACVLAELLRVQPRNLLVITPDQEGADEFSRELGFFGAAEGGPLSFPAWDVLPFSAASPHPEGQSWIG